MTLTVTDLFCGAGGSSLGAQGAGLEIVMAANHWSTAIDVHQANFPDASHDCADISQADPRRYLRTDLLLASPECTNHSQARGLSRKAQQPGLWDAPDPSAERSRATMWDVIRFAEQMHYEAMVVENVIEATKWILWPAWVTALRDLGYHYQILSHNSQHHGVAQSRDRIYIACWRDGIRPDLEMQLDAHCPRCEKTEAERGRLVDECGFRMLEPHEIAAAMAFPAGYIPRDLTKKDQVKLAGNAVTPPVMAWITGRLAQAIEAA